MNDIIYIFGHKNPDTDSVCSAICLSYLKNAQGFITEPKILSNINDETKYVLKKFKFPIPALLNDVRLQVKDVNYHENFTVGLKESVYNAFYKMQKENMSTIPLIDKDNTFKGVFAMKDIAKKVILDSNPTLKTKYDYILETINGQEILKFDEEIIGKITNIDLRSTTFYNQDILKNDTILIIGDRHSIIEDAINKKIKLIIITGGNKIKDEHMELAKKHKINIIYTKKDSYETILTIGYANYIDNFPYTKDIVVINENANIIDFNDIIKKSRHNYYPVVNNNNDCLGLIKLSDLKDVNPKKVILVDHNEITQSVDGIEEAQIIGVVDHHKLGTIGTMEPINFRSMTVGSTCTIIYELFKENKIKIPENIASLLLCGIISDTLLLKSPTTTQVDEKTLHELVKLSNLNPEKLAMEMFKANDVVNSKSLKEIIYTDFKSYNIENQILTISQITTLNSKAILKQKRSYINYLNKESIMHNYKYMFLIITDIFKNGSYILFNDNAKEITKQTFGDDIVEGSFLQDVVSRKKQILPKIMNVIK